MKYLWKEMQRHPLRVVSGVAGYALAAAFILLLTSLKNGRTADATRILKGTGTHFIAYLPSDSSCCSGISGTAGFTAEGVFTSTIGQQSLEQIRHLPGVRDAAPYLLFAMEDPFFKTSITLGGIDTSSYATSTNVCAATNLVAGIFLADDPGKMAVEESFAKAHHLSLGDRIPVWGSWVTVTGIVNTGIRTAKADFYVPIRIAREIIRDRLHINAPGYDMNIILVEVSDARNQKAVMNAVQETLDKSAISTYNCYQPASEVMGILQEFSNLMNLIVLFFLLIFAAKTQLTTVLERLREIGILKSLGWSNVALSIQILALSGLQALAGSVAGCILAVGMIAWVNMHALAGYSNLQYSWQQLLDIIGLTITGSILACILPVWKITRLRAGEILRNHF